MSSGLSCLLAVWLCLPCPAQLAFTFTNRTRGALASTPVYITVTGVDASGRLLRMDSAGVLHPCQPSDNTVPLQGTTWCPYSFPLAQGFTLEAPGGLQGGRLYLSAGAPLYLRVDPATGGLVQPDPANTEDPNAATAFDWVEFTVDGAGFHGNTTCVDQFGLPITLEVEDAAGAVAGPVGLAERRSDLLRAFRALPPPFPALVDPRGLRITAPAHAPAFLAHFDAYLQAMWERYRTRPLVLTPDEGTFTGFVEADGALVFTREGDEARYVIRARPTSRQALACDGPLAEGNGLERVLGAQLAALIHRHLLETPLAWRSPALYYRGSPANAYARFWHQHGLGGRAYGFPYDDVNDQASYLSVEGAREVRIGFRLD